MNSMECLHVFYLKIECFYSIYVVHGYHIIMMLAQISRKNIQTLFIFYHHFCARVIFEYFEQVFAGWDGFYSNVIFLTFEQVLVS